MKDDPMTAPPAEDGFTPWPAALARRYRQEGWWAGLCLGDLPRRWSARSGDREALADVHERLGYRDFADQVDRLAIGLADLGLAPGDTVVCQLPNRVAALTFTFACYRIGVRPVLALPAHREREIDHMVGLTGARALVVPDDARDVDHVELSAAIRGRHPGVAHVITVGESQAADHVSLASLVASTLLDADRARLDALRPHPESIALFLLSGGTTGLPKLIPRTHNDYHLNFRHAAKRAKFDAATRYMAVLPISHNFPYGTPGVLGALEKGGFGFIARSPNPAVALPLIAAERLTATAVVPAVAITWMDRMGDPDGPQIDLSSLDLLEVGGARLQPEAARRVGPVLGCRLQQSFGMAEGLLNCTRLDDPEEEIVGTQGRPMTTADEIRIVDADGNDVPDGEAGELITRGPYTLRGYYRAPEHNARAFTPDGFYRTGDIVRRRPGSGNLVVEGRAKDLINRGGEKISAEEIEDVLLAHPAVLNAAAVSKPHDVLGEEVAAFVVLKAGRSLALADVQAHFDARKVARFKWPAHLEALPDLPVTKVGKIDKVALRQRFE